MPQQVSTTISTNESTTGRLDEESENKFELELCWCIQQLEVTLQTAQLPDKQSRDVNKNLNALRSSNVPLIKKRQIMRTTFGDYRAKMQKDEVKYGKNSTNVKFLNSKNKDNKSLFVRKANTDDDDKNHQLKPKLSNLFSKNQLQSEPFKFNFSL